MNHRFTLVLSGVSEITSELADAIYGVTGGDIEFNMRDGVAFLEFDRSAASLHDAITSAIAQVEGWRSGCASGIRGCQHHRRCICRGHQGTIGRIAWAPCGRFIASPSEDKTTRIWDANDGKCLAVLDRAGGEASRIGGRKWNAK